MCVCGFFRAQVSTRILPKLIFVLPTHKLAPSLIWWHTSCIMPPCGMREWHNFMFSCVQVLQTRAHSNSERNNVLFTFFRSTPTLFYILRAHPGLSLPNPTKQRDILRTNIHKLNLHNAPTQTHIPTYIHIQQKC